MSLSTLAINPGVFFVVNATLAESKAAIRYI